MSRGSGGDWRRAALCAQTDPEAFFPDPGQSAALARRICGRCDVRQPCLDHALTHDEVGVWGGTTEQDRRTLRRSSR